MVAAVLSSGCECSFANPVPSKGNLLCHVDVSLQASRRLHTLQAAAKTGPCAACQIPAGEAASHVSPDANRVVSHPPGARAPSCRCHWPPKPAVLCRAGYALCMEKLLLDCLAATCKVGPSHKGLRWWRVPPSPPKPILQSSANQTLMIRMDQILHANF